MSRDGCGLYITLIEILSREGLARQKQGLRATADAELAIHRRRVGFDGFFRNAHFKSDLLVPQPLLQADQDAKLSRRKRCNRANIAAIVQSE